MGRPPQRLDGRVVLVTGAARGIGSAIARRVAAQGARVSLVGLEPAELASLSEQLGGGATWVQADVTDAEAMEEAARLTVERLGGIDVVIANAGIGASGTVLRIDPAVFDRVLEVNLMGVWRTARACLPHLLKRRGYLLNIASLAAVMPGPGMASYSASKAGVEAFSRALRAEVAHRGVSVGVAYFSWLDTDLVRGADAVASARLGRSRLKGPLGRTYPVSLAVDAVARGIERRSAVVVAPGWARALLLSRGLLAGALVRAAAHQFPQVDALIEQEHATGGAQASVPVGPGGAAAWAAHSRGNGVPAQPRIE